MTHRFHCALSTLFRPAMTSGRKPMGRKSLCVLSALGAVLLLVSAQEGRAQTYSLQQLMDGATFTIPTAAGTNLIFQNFADAFTISPHARPPGQLDPLPSGIYVTAINIGATNPGLLWQSAQWAVNPSQFIDVTWTYDVVTSDGSNSITGATTSLSSYAVPTGTDLYVSTELTSHNALLGTLRADPSSAPSLPQDDVEFFPTNGVHVEKEISLQGNMAGNASLHAFTQTFAVTPEPGAYGLFLGAGVSGALFYRRRVFRSKRQP